jgi:hypothetical protein
LTPDLEAAAADLAKTDAGNGYTYGIFVGSSFRSPKAQNDLILKYCQNPPGSADCKPFPGKPYVCPMQGNPPNPKSCPHTTGHALDLWGTRCKNGKCERCISNADACSADKTSMQKCVSDPCQQAIIKALGDQGFCRWTGEAWHFEKPGMSRNCYIGQ